MKFIQLHEKPSSKPYIDIHTDSYHPKICTEGAGYNEF